MALRLRRGTAAELASVTPAEGELIYVTDTKALFVGDGATTGGKFLTSGSSLTQNIVLNGRNITGTGNIDITGNIHATGSITADGSLTLGDSDTDNVVFAADINSSIVPNTTLTFNIGSSSKVWNTVYANQVLATTVGDATTTHVGTFKGTFVNEDSTLIIDGHTGNIYGNVTGSLTGNVTGDVTGDTTGTHYGDVQGNVTGNVVGDVSGNFEGMIKAQNGNTVLNAGTNGTDSYYTGKVYGELIGSVFAQNASAGDSALVPSPLVNALDNAINLNGTVKDNIIPGTTDLYNIGSFTVAFNDVHLASSARLFIGPKFNITLNSNHVNVKGGVYNSLPFTTTLSVDPSYSSTDHFFVASVAGIQAGARFSMPGVTERTVASVDPLLNKVTATESFSPSSTMDGGAHAGDSITFYNPGIPATSFKPTAPSTRKGAAGDVKGMVHATATTLYVCFADYTNGTPDIWGKVTLDSTSW